MNTIYKPKGRALEYSPRALNIYNGCDHGCRYCYAASIGGRSREEWMKVKRRRSLSDALANHLEKNKVEEQVLLCFTGDPYCNFDVEARITRRVLKILLEAKVPVAVLTKGGTRCLRDIDIFKSFGPNIKVGATLTSHDTECHISEPYAEKTSHRIETLERLQDEGVRTWVSFEPVLWPSVSVDLMEKCIGFVDEIKLGKINHDPGLENAIDWDLYLKTALEIARGKFEYIYVKADLWKAAPRVDVRSEEMDSMRSALVGWKEI